MAKRNVPRMGWLPPAPKELRVRLRQLATSSTQICAADLISLAHFELDLDQLIQLARILSENQSVSIPSGLSPVRLALMADGTVDYLASAIRATGLRHGILVETYTPAFGQALQETLSPTSQMWAFGPDVALIAPDHRTIGLAPPTMNSEDANAAVSGSSVRLTTLANSLASAGVSPVLQTIVAPPDQWCGHLDRNLSESPLGQISAINATLCNLARQLGAPILDADTLAGNVGREAWFDPALWHRAKLPCALEVIPLWADHICRVLAAMRGKARKCLVLDLDNTCWGGVIGDDGLEGIRLGPGSADGEAFQSVQACALSLKARGIILAVASKNEEDTARLPFQKHPEMLLREEDVAVFLANWNDKATNISHIAKRLNIGTDALAFLDDNPAERARVRQMLPEVAVPELPADTAYYPTVLSQSGLFETVALSEEDAHRAKQYQQNAARSVAMEQIGDYDAYLASLDMRCDLSPFDSVGRARIAQLTNKSNQFNLTTRRYTETDIERFENNPGIFDMQVRLADTFGDNGMISVVIFRMGKEEWICDTWLMSCRVLKRRVEEAILGAVVNAAKAAGAQRLIGEYIPTQKNRMVADHFESLGFVRAGATGPADTGTRWMLALEDYSEPDLPMSVTGSRAAHRAQVAGATRRKHPPK